MSMKYRAGDLVELRNGRKVVLADVNTGSECFPLMYQAEGIKCSVTRGGYYYDPSLESGADVVRLVSRPSGANVRNSTSDEKTLRDEFAMRILQGWCANTSVFAYSPMCGWGLAGKTYNQFAQEIYAIADEMMRVRENQNANQ